MIIRKDKIQLSWNDVERYADNLAKEIKSSLVEPSSFEIVTVTRGGLVPATLVAHRLGIKKVWVITKELIEEPIMNVSMPDTKKRLFFIDDIYDTGKTYQHMRNLLFDYDFKPCFLIMKTVPNVERPTFYYGQIIHKNYWVIFPWEKKGKENGSN